MPDHLLPSRPSRVLTVVSTALALGAALALSSCAAPAAPEGAQDPSVPPTAEAPSAAAADPLDDLDAVDGNADGVCALLAVARANQLASPASPFTVVAYSSPESTLDQICSYQSDDLESVVSIVLWHEGLTFAEQTDRDGIEVVPGSPETVFGDLGADVALSDGRVLSALSFGSTPLSKDALVALARAAAEAR